MFGCAQRWSGPKPLTTKKGWKGTEGQKVTCLGNDGAKASPVEYCTLPAAAMHPGEVSLMWHEKCVPHVLSDQDTHADNGIG